MNNLEQNIGYNFNNKSLLETALTHSSYANEKRNGVESYERLEFFGDAILSVVTAEFLYEHEPRFSEGQMTRLRAKLVCEKSLHRVAQELELGKYMRLGRGEERTGGRERPSILADMVEAIIAAMYMDGAKDKAKAFILERILSDEDIDTEPRTMDYKTELQELIQGRGHESIAYIELGESGPDHNKVFTFAVMIDGVSAGEGSGRSKKEAEQAAARRALESIKDK